MLTRQRSYFWVLCSTPSRLLETVSRSQRFRTPRLYFTNRLPPIKAPPVNLTNKTHAGTQCKQERAHRRQE